MRIFTRSVWKALAGLSLIVGLSSQAKSGSWFSAEEGQENLRQAHEAYLQKDFKQMALLIKNVMQSKSSEEEKKNALSLLSAAYKVAKAENIGTDWHLPGEVPKLVISQRRDQNAERVKYKMQMYGHTKHPGTINQLQLIQYPDKVILDKQANLGIWEIENKRNEDGFYDYSLYMDEGMPKPIDDGLYLVNISLNDGSKVQGWVLISDLASTASPEVLQPLKGAVDTSENPVIRFKDFRSPQYTANEIRTMYARISENKEPYDTKWQLDVSDEPNRFKFVVGKESGQEGVTKLEDGSYIARVAFKERRNFGDVRLMRQSATNVQFNVCQFCLSRP